MLSDLIVLETGFTQFNMNGIASYGDDHNRISGDMIALIPAAAPEPASFMLFGSGILGLAGTARRRFNK